ncbi:MAG: SusC/RagA family TonB-linked outer membrane protein, partial [Chitinophagaceae bacterium]|nr:SusC/RagA family TonB-linked outer membrane protein [Chitinophagaceae bacterium]
MNLLLPGKAGPWPIAITKLLVIMNLTALLILVTALHVSANTFSQRVSIKGENLPLEKVFNTIRKQTGFQIVYTSDILENTKPVSLDLENAELTNVLNICLKEQNLSYEIKNKIIVVKAAEPGIIAALNTQPPVSGIIRDAEGNPLAGVNVVVKGTKKGVTTDAEGKFSIEAGLNEILVISSIGYNTKEVKIDQGEGSLSVQLVRLTVQMDTAEVMLSTGYQVISPARATGSFSTVDKKLFNRRVGPNVLDRIENLVPGVLFNANNSTDKILIRGRSTIHSDPTPLIVLDNFPYDASLDNINPNDVESITVLKDAAAASIWGARAANGVIVITTKRGTTLKPQLSLNTNVTIQQRPDFSTMPIISSADYIEVEKFLFQQGKYDEDEFLNDNNYGHPPFTPVIELLLAQRKGLISEADANSQIERFKNIDTRTDVGKYLYQNSVNQQYALNMSGNTSNVNYYFSAGWDKGIADLVGTGSNRVSLRSRNTFKITQRLQLDAGINYIQNDTKSGDNPGITIGSGGKGVYPYTRLVDEAGTALIFPRRLRQMYTDTAGGGTLLDWAYRPLNDIYSREVKNKTRDFLLNTGLRYQFTSFLSAELKYQFQNTVSNFSLYNKSESYEARDMINSFTQVATDGTLSYPVPKGGILDASFNELIAHQARGQINYAQEINKVHEISAIAGIDIRAATAKGNMYRMYGYTPENSRVTPVVDFINYFPQYDFRDIVSQIPNIQSVSETNERIFSYYLNASYSYDKRFSFYFSGRNDGANIFGAKTNRQRGVPLWSVGGSWQISNEKFYQLDWLPSLKTRFTYGYNGNFSRSSNPYTTISTSVSSFTGLLSAKILNPPNADLRWERVGIFNIGIDFSTKKQIVSGSIDFYEKKAVDLLGQYPVDPTLGVGNLLFA